MSSHIILGKPGAGKSLYGMHILIKQLRETQRNIVTNLPIRLDELNVYLNLKFPDENLLLMSRLRIMSDDEMSNYWKLRGPEIPAIPGSEPDTILTPAFPNGHDGGRGVCYILDEAHIAFNARDWSTLARDCIKYMSQHRKLGDIIFPITQSVGNLDKQFRSVAEDYTVLRNEYTAKLGPFRGAGRFVRRSYYGEPQRNTEPFETATFTIDRKGIAGCYDTARGIGVHGSKADIGRRAKGIPIWWVFPIVIGLAMLVVFVPMLIGKMTAKFIAGPSTALGKLGEATKGLPVAASRGSTASGVTTVVTPSQDANLVPAMPEAPPKPRPVITGYFVHGKEIAVVMSDGTVVTEDDNRVKEIKRGRVHFDGGWLTLSDSPRAEQSAARKISQDFYNKELDIRAKEAESSGVQSYDGVTKPQNTIKDETSSKDSDRVNSESGQARSSSSAGNSSSTGSSHRVQSTRQNPKP